MARRRWWTGAVGGGEEDEATGGLEGVREGRSGRGEQGAVLALGHGLVGAVDLLKGEAGAAGAEGDAVALDAAWVRWLGADVPGGGAVVVVGGGLVGVDEGAEAGEDLAAQGALDEGVEAGDDLKIILVADDVVAGEGVLEVIGGDLVGELDVLLRIALV